MKRIEKYIYIVLIIILVGVLSAGTTYILMDKNNDNNLKNHNKNDNQDTNSNIISDSIKLKRTYNSNDEIIEEFEITLNNKTQIIKAVFKCEYDHELYDGIYKITGFINDTEIYHKEVEAKTTTKEEFFNIKAIKEKFNEKSFQIIKGTDNKSYLLVTSIGNLESVLHVFNDKLELLSNNIVDDEVGRTGFNITYFYNSVCGLEEENIWYEDTFGINEKHIYIKVEDNKIYFLTPILNWENAEKEFGVLEERVYTINNDKLEYKVINTYKITELCQLIQ